MLTYSAIPRFFLKINENRDFRDTRFANPQPGTPAKVVARLLESPSLEDLDVGDNGIGAPGAAALAAGLTADAALAALALRGNRIGAAGGEALLRSRIH